ncbi:unnamed protein product [Cyclocybe aegerita]|uniref:Uncharacterized protein n=1 Tax=Cyclocybe aegerita TaxID=1973307 RepID=A0A8S0W5R0_CYCAE|nr:unnamed protein product [Cyclocybe aegerita]
MGLEPAAIVVPPSSTLYKVHPVHCDKPPTTPMESQPEDPMAPTQPLPLPPSKCPATDFSCACEQILACWALKAASSSSIADLAHTATAPPISTAPAPVTMDAACCKYIDLGALIQAKSKQQVTQAGLLMQQSKSTAMQAVEASSVGSAAITDDPLLSTNSMALPDPDCAGLLCFLTFPVCCIMLVEQHIKQEIIFLHQVLIQDIPGIESMLECYVTNCNWTIRHTKELMELTSIHNQDLLHINAHLDQFHARLHNTLATTTDASPTSGSGTPSASNAGDS